MNILTITIILIIFVIIFFSWIAITTDFFEGYCDEHFYERLEYHLKEEEEKEKLK